MVIRSRLLGQPKEGTKHTKNTKDYFGKVLLISLIP